VLKDVSLDLNGRSILKDINLVINEGESVALVGPNGVGKTSIINCMLRLQRITGGVLINDFESLPKYKVGVHSQEQTFENLMTVKEILDLFLFDGEYESLVEEYGLKNLLNQRIGGLSTGEFKKLSLIILLENDPEIIFIDEITTGLDFATRLDVLKFLKNYVKKSKKTLIMVTHYLEEVEEVSNKIIFLKNGKIIESGLKNELCTKYNINNSENRLNTLYKQIYNK